MHKRKAAGFSLLELVITMALIAAVSAALLPAIADRVDAQHQVAAAKQLIAYSQAVQTYVTANSASLQASTGPSTAVQITPAQLASLLPANFNVTTPYGQTLTACVWQPTAGQLAPLALTVGGRALTDLQVASIALDVTESGGYGGGISTRNTGSIVSGSGYWSIPASTCGASPGVGHVANGIFVAYASTTDDALHRHSNGNATLNTMSTDLNMGNNNITNANQVSAKTFVAAAGNGLNIGGSYVYGDSSNLALRAGSGNVYIQTPSGGASGSIVQVHNINGDGSSTFTAYNISAANTLYAGGNVVSAGGVSANGNITTSSDVVANGAVYASNWLRTYGNTGWYSQTYGGGWFMQDSTWVRAYNDKSVYTGGTIRAGHIQSDSRLYAKEFIELDGVASAGGGCSPNGLIGRTSTGGFLYCESGVWKSAGGFSSYQIVQGPGANGFNNSIATCPGGYTLLGGGSTITYNPFGTLPGAQSWPLNSSQWAAESTDTRVWVTAWALCAK